VTGVQTCALPILTSTNHHASSVQCNTAMSVNVLHTHTHTRIHKLLYRRELHSLPVSLSSPHSRQFVNVVPTNSTTYTSLEGCSSNWALPRAIGILADYMYGSRSNSPDRLPALHSRHHVRLRNQPEKYPTPLIYTAWRQMNVLLIFRRRFQHRAIHFMPSPDAW